MSFSELRAISRRNNYRPHNCRQGKTHHKWGHYKSFYKYSGVSLRPDKRDYEDCGEYVTYLRHKNRKPNNDFGYWNDRFAPTENNWKEKKIRKQYMWHKPRHYDTSKEKEQND